MKSLTIAAAAIAATLATTSVHAEGTAQYQIQFNSTWTAQSHPLDYPANAHHSGLVGATHNASFRLFSDSGTATPGLEALAERGAHAPLTDEVQASIGTGAAGALFESTPLFSFPGTLSATFTADDAHPYVSAAAMIAPSPDWFTGVSGVALKKDGKWIDQVTLTLFAWDAGTDGGATYQAANADSQPVNSVRLNASPHFIDNDGLKPIGTVTFSRMKKTASN